MSVDQNNIEAAESMGSLMPDHPDVAAAPWSDQHPPPRVGLGPSEIAVDFVHYDPESRRPDYQTTAASGMDLCSSEFKFIAPGRAALINTGIMMAIPVGHTGLICPRSGLALKHSITVLNAPGVIDPDFRGELRVLLINHGSETFHVKPGDRIAQLVIVPTLRAVLNTVSHLPDTLRGSGGFGSTGV